MASERDHKVFYGNQSIRGFFEFESSFHNGFGIFLAPLSCLKSVKWEMAGNFQVLSQGILWSKALKSLLRV
jgi:hypothetical protein